ncbi:MAG TPA: tetratricopeptide repeat protein [Bryobacteraceae bacterium]|nr:tetratricopeptide repeat protein [Bryobacteraceae bacterium]
MTRRFKFLTHMLRVLAGMLVLTATAILFIIVLFYRGENVRTLAAPALMFCLCGLIPLVIQRLRRRAQRPANRGRLVPWLTPLALKLSRLGGRCSPGAAQMLYDTGVFLSDQCRYREACGKLREAADLFEELDERQNRALALIELGNCHNAAGNHAEAVAVLQQALGVWEKLAHRQREDNTWRLFNNLGVALTELGELQDAEGYCRRALQTCLVRREAGDPEAAMCLLNLADVHRRQRRFLEAEEALSQSLEILDRTKDGNFAFGVSLLAMLHDDQDRLREAEELYRQARELLESQLGPRHVEVAKVLECHGAMLERGGRENDGAKLRARAASIFETIR